MKKVDSIMYDDNKMMDQPFLIFMHATVVLDWSSMHTIFSRLVHARINTTTRTGNNNTRTKVALVVAMQT